MRYGISAAALVVRRNRLLLVHHQEQPRYDFWVPPGGRLEGEESILECARRETLEETGLQAKPEHIVYIQEFVEPGYHFCKFFIKCSADDSERVTLDNLEPDEGFVVDVRFFTREQLERLTVYPEALKAQFWEDLAAGFPRTRYLGLEKIAF